MYGFDTDYLIRSTIYYYYGKIPEKSYKSKDYMVYFSKDNYDVGVTYMDKSIKYCGREHDTEAFLHAIIDVIHHLTLENKTIFLISDENGCKCLRAGNLDSSYMSIVSEIAELLHEHHFILKVWHCPKEGIKIDNIINRIQNKKPI